ncbi:MAG: hypothetical protein U9Q06_04025 [Nanoarchaeota archaeon]|nr:hypothetical protein [Nanoarchaeota archaeon]
MKQINIESAGVLGQICGSQETIQKILQDEFTYHYLPEAKIDYSERKPEVFVEETQDNVSLKMDYPKIIVPFTKDHRGLISACEYLLERARQEKVKVYSLNSSSVQEDGNSIIFYGGATNLGKTSSALELAVNGFELFSDEKTLLDLANQTLCGGSRSIALRKKIIQEKVGSLKEFKEFSGTSCNHPNISMLILPHLDHGLENPITYQLDSRDAFWHLNKEIARRIRGDTKFYGDYKYALQSLDNEDLSNQRIKLVKSLTKTVPTHYFQGNLKQLTDFVKERFNKS